MTRNPIIAVLQFPGSNCEHETVRALRAVRLEAEVFRWNRPADELPRFDGYVIPGGFSYEDRVRAGVIAAKEPVLEKLASEAEAGKPLLGICNGAQILLETGLVPGLKPGEVEMALARNYMTVGGKVARRGHHCGWVNLRFDTEPKRTPFTSVFQRGDITPMTVSHGEGRFMMVDRERVPELEANGQIVWRYCSANGSLESELPVNPNGALDNIAGLCNPKGNVLAMMPHPERSFYLRQVPSTWTGDWGDRRRRSAGVTDDWNQPGPGFSVFQSLSVFFAAAS